MIKLYYRPGACSLAPHIALEFIGQPYEAELAQRDSTAILELNPAGAVPILDTGEGWILTQAAAILQYLDKRFPEAKLGSTGDLKHDSELTRWASFLTGDLHPAFYPIYFPNRYTVSTKEEDLENVKQAALKIIRRKLAVIEQHLDKKDYMVGANLTYVDIYLFPMLRWAKFQLADDGGLKNYTNIERLFAKLKHHPVFTKTLELESK
ncbi:glutathione S-transferase family protein [Entomobacter blattae]|uniref:Glutathione S-transferase GST-4.5 n=1 Tax=Entomobacter blattae TaxID=2762277 RepID=A0A7H1NQF3_9PROT|nr:glutathione S-transferase family protein [Entomobacter blattae]QNT78013.1 Glutathione S-transferase GST-4.5 [Entomobacter blattae]